MLRNYYIFLSLTLEISCLFVLFIFIQPISYGQDSKQFCITYDSEENVITVNCTTATLTDIDNQLKDQNILQKETSDGVWLLNAGIKVDEDAILYINSSDVTWLKMVAGNKGQGQSANGIEVFGSLKIESVKMTSWDPSTNNYAKNPGNRDLSGDHYKVQEGSPRPFISVESDATGTTDIINSEIAYLGYEGGVGGGPVVGLTYFGGDGSIIRDNNIHHLYFAFYSNGVGNITIADNDIHHNGHYGLDPHTGTHDMIIRNNTVHDNGSIGIICSLDCYKITIENNKVYNNTKMGIMLSRNMYDSVARNNIVSHEDKGLVISESHSNEIYNNTVLESGRGIDLDRESSNNTIHYNTMKNISDPSDALHVENGAAEENKLYFNELINSNGQVIVLDPEDLL